MPQEPKPASTNAIEIANNRLPNDKIRKIFEVSPKNNLRHPGVWQNEEAKLRGKLGAREDLLTKINPEARDPKSKGYATRTGVLLIAEGLEQQTPSYDLAKSVIAELVINNRPDVVAWTLKRVYKERFKDVDEKKLTQDLKDKVVTIPDDFKRTIVLGAFDECEFVGHKEIKRNQTPLTEIVTEVVKAVRESEVKPPEPFDSRVDAPAPTLDLEALEKAAKENALKAAEVIRKKAGIPSEETQGELRKRLARKRSGGGVVREDEVIPTFRKKKVTEIPVHGPTRSEIKKAEALKKKNVPENLIQFAQTQPNAEECLDGLAKLNFAGHVIQIASRITSTIGSDVQSRFISENKFFQAALDSLYGTVVRGGTANPEPMIGLCDYILVQVDKKPKNPYIRDMAFQLMNNILGNIHSTTEGVQRQQILQRLIGLTEAFVGKKLNPVEMGLVNIGGGNEYEFNRDDPYCVETKFSDALINDNDTDLRPGAFEALNDPKSSEFLSSMQNASEDNKNQTFFYELRQSLKRAGYEIVSQENHLKVIKKDTRKSVKVGDERPELILITDLQQKSFAEIARIKVSSENMEIVRRVLEGRVKGAADVILQDISKKFKGNTEFLYREFISDLNMVMTLSAEGLLKASDDVVFESNEKVYNTFVQRAKEDGQFITIPYKNFIERTYQKLGITLPETEKKEVQTKPPKTVSELYLDYQDLSVKLGDAYKAEDEVKKRHGFVKGSPREVWEEVLADSDYKKADKQINRIINEQDKIRVNVRKIKIHMIHRQLGLNDSDIRRYRLGGEFNNKNAASILEKIVVKETNEVLDSKSERSTFEKDYNNFIIGLSREIYPLNEGSQALFFNQHSYKKYQEFSQSNLNRIKISPDGQVVEAPEAGKVDDKALTSDEKKLLDRGLDKTTAKLKQAVNGTLGELRKDPTYKAFLKELKIVAKRIAGDEKYDEQDEIWENLAITLIKYSDYPSPNNSEYFKRAFEAMDKKFQRKALTYATFFNKFKENFDADVGAGGEKGKRRVLGEM